MWGKIQNILKATENSKALKKKLPAFWGQKRRNEKCPLTLKQNNQVVK